MADAEVSTVVHRAAVGPRRIGRYDICFELASGGMATVYLARLDGMGGFSKLVALKCIHPHLVRQEGFVEMFMDEARLASRIDHPGVCAVFDFGFGDGTYYMAMECLVGETLARVHRLTSQRPHLSPLPDHAFYMARIVTGVADALHAAHELRSNDGQFLNLVHRDVSPQNLMVTYDGAVKIMDFGIASAVDQLHLTKTGTVRGKFAYMSPEQLDGKELDRRSDIWSLGVVFWELLTGRQLFGGPSEATAMRAVLEAPIVPPSVARPGVPKELDDVVLRCLARSPAERFPTAAALSEALSALKPKRGPPVTAAVLAEWLRALFPDLYARRLELVEQARQMTADGVLRVSRMLSQPDIETHRMSELTPAPKKTRRLLWPGAAALALVALGAFAVVRSRSTPRNAQPSSSAAAAPAATARALAAPKAEPAKNDAPLSPAETDAPSAPPSSSAAPDLAPADRAPAPAPRVRAAAPASTSSPASEPGSVDVATPGGWADVSIGAHRYGRTPLRLTLPAGRRTVTLRPFGQGAPRSRVVVVQPGKLSRLVVSVEPPKPESSQTR